MKHKDDQIGFDEEKASKNISDITKKWKEANTKCIIKDMKEGEAEY